MNAPSLLRRVPTSLVIGGVLAVALFALISGAKYLFNGLVAKEAARDAAILAPWEFTSNTCRMPDGTKVELVAPTMKEEVANLEIAKETVDGRKLRAYTTADTTHGAWYCIMAWRKR